MSFGLFSDSSITTPSTFTQEQQPTTLIDICIPTFREEDYIVRTLQKLQEQTMFSRSHVWIGDYDPENEGLTRKAVESVGLPNVTIVNVDHAGIGYARKVATEAGSAQYILNFDADCYFARPDAMEFLIKPLLSGEADATHTGNVMDSVEAKGSLNQMVFYLRNELVKVVPLAYEQGFMYSRKVYNISGGWSDVKAAEAPILASNMMLKGLRLRHVEEALVIVSARRMGTTFDMDYSNAYRNGKVIPTGKQGDFLGLV